MRITDVLLDVAGRLPGGIIINFHLLHRDEVRAAVDLLGPRFDFIAHHELPGRLARRSRRPFCLLTFDDGKRSNATETGPALAELGVPAVFYVVTGFLDDGARPLWFDRVGAIVRRLGTPPPELRPAVLKRLPHALREERIARACADVGVDADLRDDDVRPMSWDEARGLARRGFTIGAHSEWHTILTNESLERAREDIAGSIATVSARIGHPCRTFSFPNGNYTASLCRHAEACGAATVMTTEPMWAGSWSQSWRLPRIQLAGGQPRRHQALKLAVARVPSLLANPDGTGRLYVPMQWIARRHAAHAGRSSRN